MSKPAKQALVAELTTALAPLLTPTSVLLPKSIAQAVDDLAESILRWQTRQARPTRSKSSQHTESSSSDALACLMNSHLHEEAEAVSHDVEMEEMPTAPLITPSLSAVPVPQKERLSLLKPGSPHA